MNKLSTLIIAVTALLGSQWVNAQNCSAYEIQLNKEVQANNYDAAYPILNKALAECPSEKINFYNFGETILVGKIEKAATDAEKTKLAGELAALIDKRVANFPGEKKAFWEGEKINYQLKYGVLDQMAAYQAYAKLFEATDDDTDAEKVSASTVLTYYTTALELMNAQQLGFEEVLEVYFQTKKVAEDNIELRSVEYGTLAEKLDSIKQLNPSKDLTPAEKQIMANAQASKDIFVEVNESMEHVLQEYTTCENLSPMFENQFEANKDNLDWLGGSYQALASKDCYDLPIMERLEARYAQVWQKENPSQTVASSGPSGGNQIASSYGDGVRKYKAGNFSGAIASFQQAINEVTGTTRGDVAYYIALSYQKTGSNANAVTWANRAAGYKPGWGAPYQLIAGAFAASANSCGANEFEKRVAYWVAADYANKACAVDSRSCSWGRSAARSYEGNAPTIEQAFAQGKSAGDAVSISCLGGATTRVR